MTREILKSFLLTLLHASFIFLLCAVIEKFFSIDIPYIVQLIFVSLYVFWLFKRSRLDRSSE